MHTTQKSTILARLVTQVADNLGAFSVNIIRNRFFFFCLASCLFSPLFSFFCLFYFFFPRIFAMRKSTAFSGRCSLCRMACSWEYRIHRAACLLNVCRIVPWTYSTEQRGDESISLTWALMWVQLSVSLHSPPAKHEKMRFFPPGHSSLFIYNKQSQGSCIKG